METEEDAVRKILMNKINNSFVFSFGCHSIDIYLAKESTSIKVMEIYFRFQLLPHVIIVVVVITVY